MTCYKHCISCGNPVQIRETEMCAPCTFGEAASFDDYDFVQYEEEEVPIEDRIPMGTL